MKTQKMCSIIQCYQQDPKTLQEVLAGIEEEGGLAEVQEELFKKTEDILAQQAAKQSALGVGIGIYKEKVAIAFNTQVGLVDLDFTYKTPRIFGQNATRYTKNRPFI